MKNVVRALTLALAVTGMTAATQVPAGHAKVIRGKVDAYIPVCPPNDPAACHIKGN